MISQLLHICKQKKNNKQTKKRKEKEKKHNKEVALGKFFFDESHVSFYMDS